MYFWFCIFLMFWSCCKGTNDKLIDWVMRAEEDAKKCADLVWWLSQPTCNTVTKISSVPAQPLSLHVTWMTWKYFSLCSFGLVLFLGLSFVKPLSPLLPQAYVNIEGSPGWRWNNSPLFFFLHPTRRCFGFKQWLLGCWRVSSFFACSYCVK